jgi:PhoPQ-activated pathogenicity-related protein
VPATSKRTPSIARLWLIACLSFASVALARADVAPSTALQTYVAAADPAFGWQVRARGSVDGAEYAELLLTSQTWRGQPWRHQLFIVRPDDLAADTHAAVLFISGGRWRDEYLERPGERSLPSGAGVYVKLAHAARAPLAILRQVPFQPIFDGLTEDDAIAYTFDRFLEDRDASWPLLLPMVKSAVRAMDAVQSYTREQWSLDIDAFTVTGASKRGWTTWLTGVVDPRVQAIAPMVIDVLNMESQMQLARTVWGGPSEMISPYTDRAITERLATPAGRELLAIVDPYSYRQQLSLPKIIINATNDPYWPLTAASLYWDALPGEKRLLYVPNEGHSVRDYGRLLGAIAGLHRAMAGGPPLPELGWRFDERSDRVVLDVEASERPSRVQGWVASSPTRDFRGAHWRRIEMKRDGDGWQAAILRPHSDYFALYGETIFRRGRTAPLYLSTAVRTFEPRWPRPSGDSSEHDTEPR